MLTVYKLLEDNVWKNWSKLYDKMDLPIRMRIFYNINIVVKYVWNLEAHAELLVSSFWSKQRPDQYLLHNQRKSIFLLLFSTFVIVNIFYFQFNIF